MLSRSMRGEFHVNVVAMIVQRDHRGLNQFERVKVSRSKSGMQHWIVVQPLSLAGIEANDDGKRWQTYLPDERLLTDQASPSREGDDLASQIGLARKNYNFELSPHSDIAGRNTVCVTATPHFPVLETRRYCLDKETAYPLRLESVRPSGEVTLAYDTKDIQFPARISPSVFVMNPLPGVRKQVYDRPRNLSRHEAERIFGFAPIVPRTLPFGFKVLELQDSRSSDWKSVVLRISDGLVRANVYQYLPDGKPKRPMADATPGDFHGILLMIVSDSLGPELRKQLLDSVISQAEAEGAKEHRPISRPRWN